MRGFIYPSIYSLLFISIIILFSFDLISAHNSSCIYFALCRSRSKVSLNFYNSLSSFPRRSFYSVFSLNNLFISISSLALIVLRFKVSYSFIYKLSSNYLIKSRLSLIILFFSLTTSSCNYLSYSNFAN